ncbi:hypothetical protein GY45DRAFT_1337965 [Cubamyces sp. BRFM 1775]|nr:hypothetical protein GY45DRAFT_1337965 [Cubamyces sp. BRFM 1775]
MALSFYIILQTLQQRLALLSALQSSDVSTGEGSPETHLPGGLSCDDLTNMAPVTLDRILNERVSAALEDELQKTLLSIADYLVANDPTEDVDDDERLQAASQLPQTIRQRKEALAEQRRSLEQTRAQVLELAHRINDPGLTQAHPELEAQLTLALETIPPQLRATRTAQTDVLAATIEAALLKLSLLRARAHRALYGFSAPRPGPAAHAKSDVGKTTKPTKPPEHSDATVAHAVAAAYRARRVQERAQEEMRELDGQIAAYEGMLSFVDGSRPGREGAFAQVVSDMARVKRETEECLQELKRLGWTEG